MRKQKAEAQAMTTTGEAGAAFEYLKGGNFTWLSQ
jgi:hypothetical protein